MTRKYQVGDRVDVKPRIGPEIKSVIIEKLGHNEIMYWIEGRPYHEDYISLALYPGQHESGELDIGDNPEKHEKLAFINTNLALSRMKRK